MRLSEIWRYPVKSMAGERLQEADLGPAGVSGDRVLQVLDARGRLVTSRSKPHLLLRHAVLGPEGEPLIDGRAWDSEESRRAVTDAAGPGTRLVRPPEEDRFDVLPLLVITDGALREFGRDPRRLRPNLVLGGVEGMAERAWEGRLLRVGGAVLALHDRRERCIMTTFDPDTVEQDVGVLRDIRDRFEGRLGLNARVVRPGRVREGDPIDWVDASRE